MSHLHDTVSPDAREQTHPLVLVVEDHDDTREMLELLLGIFGCRVIAAGNGEQAVTLAEQTHPDLILMDMNIPLLDGLTVTRIIRAQAALNRVPIVAVTGFDTPKHHAAALKAGCNYCIAKPIDLDLLEELVKRLTRPTSRNQYSPAARSRGPICSYHLQ